MTPPQNIICFYFIFSFFNIGDSASVQQLARTATEIAQVSRSRAMDVRLKKVAPGPLHTTGGLLAAKATMSTGENKIFYYS